MIIIRALAFLLFFTVVPFAVGRLITYRAKSGFISDYLIGFFGNLGIFYVIFAFCNWGQIWRTYTDPVIGAFSRLCHIYIAVIAVLVLLWIYLDRAILKDSISFLRKKAGGFASDLKRDKFLYVYVITFAILLSGPMMIMTMWFQATTP